MKTKKIAKMPMHALTNEVVERYRAEAIEEGYDELAFEWDSDLGPYVTIDLHEPIST